MSRLFLHLWQIDANHLFGGDPGAKSHRNGAGGTGLFTFPAADAFQSVRGFDRVHLHRTDLGAFSAADAFFLIYPKLIEGDGICQPIDGSQGTKIFAEGPVG